MKNNNLYQNIKRRRIELGMSQRDLAEKLGYSNPSSIARIERGDNDITLDLLDRIAKALNTSPVDLVRPGMSYTLREGRDIIVEIYDRMDDNMRSRLEEYARLLYESKK